jgi:hypothetical protein
MEVVRPVMFKGEKRLSLTVDGVKRLFPESPDAPLRAGTRVVKCVTEPRDGHKDGDVATIITSAGPMPEGADCKPEWWGLFMYFVVWDDAPEVPVGIVSYKIKEWKEGENVPSRTTS